MTNHLTEAQEREQTMRLAMINHPFLLTWGEELAKAIEGNHVISGGNGPNWVAGWEMANSCAADLVRLHISQYAAKSDATTSAASAVVASDERARFEARYRRDHRYYELEHLGDGYVDPRENSQWEGWQAAKSDAAEQAEDAAASLRRE